MQKQFKGLDTYFVKVFPENHPSEFLYKLDKTEWDFQFSFSRINPKTGKSSKKDSFKLIFKYVEGYIVKSLANVLERIDRLNTPFNKFFG
ncbi:MAG: hypothetical protein U5N85_19965 [Arcicella sp.]|nr:hypothetical protein [Arcicella sp.]